MHKLVAADKASSQAPGPRRWKMQSAWRELFPILAVGPAAWGGNPHPNPAAIDRRFWRF